MGDNNQELVRWDPESAATAFQTSASTVRRRLKKAGIDPNRGFSTQDLLKAFSGAEDDRVRETRARTEGWELRVRKLRNSFKPTRFMRAGLSALIKASLNIVDDSELSKRDKQDISESISSMVGVVDTALSSQSALIKALKRDKTEDENEDTE